MYTRKILAELGDSSEGGGTSMGKMSSYVLCIFFSSTCYIKEDTGHLVLGSVLLHRIVSGNV